MDIRTQRAVIFVNGHIETYDWLHHRLRPDDYLIGADGGTRHCLAVNRLPHVVVGDMDSIDPALLARLAAQGVIIERHPTRKDWTDLELAIRRAVADGAGEVLLVGALGGRLDQTFANLLVSARREWTVPVLLADGYQTAQVLRSDECFTLTGAVGSTVSVIPLSQEVTGITYTGLEYPLIKATLPLGSTRGVSNVIAHSPATICIEDGVALVVQEEARSDDLLNDVSV